MARATRKEFKIDLQPAIDVLGLPEVLRQVGVKRLLEAVGVERLIEHVGPEQLSKQLGMHRYLASLSAADRRELKRLLEGK